MRFKSSIIFRLLRNLISEMRSEKIRAKYIDTLENITEDLEWLERQQEEHERTMRDALWKQLNASPRNSSGM